MRSFQTNARIRSLTTGTFNRVVKDRIAFRLSGANSVQANPHKCESDCPRNLTNIPRPQKPCQRMHPTEFSPLFHNGNSGKTSARGAKRSKWGQPPSAVPVEQSSTGNPWKSSPSGPRQPSKESGALAPARTLKRAQRYGLPPLRSAHFRRRIFRPREGGRQKIEKRSFLEVLALKVPFRNLLVFPNQAPWPGRLRDFIPLKP